MTTVGLLGGMGPLATLDFMSRLVRLTPAQSDQDHLRLLVDCDPSVPDRTAHILRGSDAPGVHLARMATGLEAHGADFLVMICNTAHAYYEHVVAAVAIPVVDWIEEVATDVAAAGPDRVGLLATEGTVAAGLYDRALARHGVSAISPSPEDMTEMMDVIYGVKAGGPSPQQALRMRSLMEGLQARGADVALIACTELSVLASHFPSEGTLPEVDAADVVARRTVTRATPAKCPSIPSRVVSP